MFIEKSFSHLPHFDQQGSYQFITFRTKESLDDYLKRLYRSGGSERVRQYRMDRYLDHSPRGALLYGKVIERIRDYYLGCDRALFELEALCVMPNHIHVLIRQHGALADIMRYLKGGAAHLVNEVLGRRGSVWSRDYYDRAIRDERHYDLVYDYIKYNAVKAGLKDASERFYGKYG